MARQALLEFKNISKAFGDRIANKNVSFSVMPGTIHALVGENGAGKSTIMKILFGLYRKDSGEIYHLGHPLLVKSPIAAKNIGIGMVHQHFMLAGPITALDHILLDDRSENSMFLPLKRKKKLEDLNHLCRKFNMPVDWQSEVRKLSVGIQQRVEILKLLNNNAKILILDEPTAVLSPQESEVLYSQLIELRSQGHTILLVTHRLKDVFKYADEVTVFRQGMTIASMKTSDTNLESLSELMVGHRLQKWQGSKISPQKEVCLELNSLQCNVLGLKKINFNLHKGEILGVAGIEGNGQSGLIQYLMNPLSFAIESGSVHFNGMDLTKFSNLQIRKNKIAFFPEDRHSQGSIEEFSLMENFLLGLQYNSKFNKNGWIDFKNLKWVTKTEVKDFDVRPGLLEQKFSELSGGNQQKLVVARELYCQPELLVAAQPTRGVDIGAIERIHNEIIELRNRGSGILLISSDLDELLKLSDRILVMYQGTIVGEFSRDHFDESQIGQLMTGGRL